MSHKLMQVCLKLVVVLENIKPMRKVIMEDQYTTYREIRTTINIGITSKHKILHGICAKDLCSFEFA